MAGEGTALRCKPGDLAIIVRAAKDPRWYGRIVLVVAQFDHDSWVTDPLPAGFCSVRDTSLRPIRPGDGEDEMLRIAGKPEEITA